ncbi:MAG TPA: DUF3426 domain-containing protein [Steroidobacteraceae bacterium]|nr:DUF3426 domain-containing protein [Steroidobacteraceae bacterium]
MFTVCPKCALTLVVTAADLRIAQGYVRCGRCSSVFNALARLTDDRQAAESLSESQQPAAPQAESSAHAFELAATAALNEPSKQPEPRGEDSHPDSDSQRQAQHQDAPREEAAAREQSPPESHAAAVHQAGDVPAMPTAGAAAEIDAPAPPPPTPPADPSGAAPTAATDEESIPESALEFNPTTADVAAVFIEPPPDPAWTAATGTFKAMIAETQLSAPADSSSEKLESAGRLPDTSLAEATSPAATSPAATSPAATSADPGSSGELAEPSSPGAAEAHPGASSGAQATSPSPIVDPRPALPVRGAPARVREAAYAVRARSGFRHSVSQGRPPVTAAARRPAPEEPRDDRDLSLAVDLIDESAFDEERHEQERARARIWGVAVAIASLFLLVQIVHHYRDELAVRAGLNRPLTALYAALGMPLVPRWDLRAYDVRQLGAVADPATAGLITVRATIKNSAQQAQPLPLLRVTLQDRFGNRIAARDVAPRSYLAHATPDSSLLGAGQRIDAAMGFVDPGANAVGFEIDACLPQRGGAIACANDSALR